MESRGGAPLSGAFVVLLDGRDRQRGAALTDGDGQFIIRAPLSGTYRLRVERIGFSSTETDPFALRTGRVWEGRIPVPLEPIPLEGIEASGKARCRVPREVGAATSLLWEEARKALSISEWVRTDRGAPYQVMTWERERNARTLAIREQRTEIRSGYGRAAFNSVKAEDLASKGFVRRLGGGVYQYFGLDAATLLSDEFLATHCFRVRDPSSEEPDLIGLGFEPLPSHAPPDIEGVLWLDRGTAELRFLEFTFTRHLHGVPVPPEPFGGRVDFHRLANGVWIVDGWWLRMPRFPRELMAARPIASGGLTGTAGDRLAEAQRKGLRTWEEGGKVLFFLQPRDVPGGTSRVEGIVFDSTRGHPLSGATVFLTETRHSTRTDSGGRFAIQGVPAGKNAIGFLHPYADSVGLVVVPRAIIVPSEGSLDVQLAIPKGTGCLPPGGKGGTPAVAGIIIDRETGNPLSGASVTAEWRSGTGTTRGSSPFSRISTTETGADGRFFLCGFPPGAKVRISARHPRGEVVAGMEIETEGLVFQELLVGGEQPAP